MKTGLLAVVSTLSLLGLVGAVSVPPQVGDGPRNERLGLDLVLAAEKARTELISRLEPTVCAVMSLSRPGGGSGVIISPKGWILTNYHVVTTNKVMKIGLPDGKFYLADVIGVDPGGDIALCALRGKGTNPDGTWPHAILGDSDKLKLGGFVYAMGNPFLLATDFKPTVTAGIVSGIHRFQKGTGPNGRMLMYPDCVQVDAAVNPGNSGGPLFDENGLLVGINGRITIRDRGRVNTGAGFAVSIQQIKGFLPDLLAGKHCEHGTSDMSAWTMEDPNMGGRRGVFAQALFEDSVAWRHGIRLGDEILTFNGRRVRTANQLGKWTGRLPAGFVVDIGYRRFDEGTRSYGPVRHARFPLAALPTGSNRNPRPNVPDFSRRPDFARLISEAKKREEREKNRRLSLQDLVLPKGFDVPKGWKKALPKGWRGKIPRKFRGKVKVKKTGPSVAELERDQGLFLYMDGVVSWLRERVLARIPKGEGKKRRVRLMVQVPSRKGSYERTWELDGPRILRSYRGTTLDSAALAEMKNKGDQLVTLRRERSLLPFLDPVTSQGFPKDAYVEGGAFVAGPPVWVLALRGPGKRALYIDGKRFVPVGCRYRSPADGGLVEVVATSWKEGGNALLYPLRFEKRVDKILVETWEVPQGNPLSAGLPGFRILEQKLPRPSSVMEDALAPLLESVVKIVGASGLKGVEGYGSGLIVSKKGFILTWDHIMLQPGQIKVVLADGSIHEARIYRRAEELGLAMLKIDPGKQELRPIPIPREKRELPPGTYVWSMGNAFKLAEFDERVTVVEGVITGSLRSDLRLNLRKFPYKGRVYLTDAPSNPGTQGGGLFTTDGKLVGMLTPHVESRETNTQLSLAIPAEDLAPFVALCLGDRSLAKNLAARSLRAKAKAPVYTGIKLFDTGRRRSPPAYVDRVFPDSPAQRAGIRPDDMIVRVNDYPIRTCAEFRRALKAFGPGESIDLTLKRGSRVTKVTLVLEAKK